MPGQGRPDQPLDAIARDLASGAISRRTALRRFAGVALAAALPEALFADPALASCPQSRRCSGKCCPSHAHCLHGKCKCRRGFTKCGKSCRDLQSDPRNCGSCGHKCPAGQTCHNGHCKAGQPQQVCGNGIREGTEQCDGSDLGGQDCTSIGMGFVGGTLACSSGCAFDTSGCTAAPTCGDGIKNGTEQCDGSDLGGQDCTSIGMGFVGGTLACSSGCTFDTSGCTAAPTCGDGIKNGTEQCDGNDLGGSSCQDLGFAGGSLACLSNCTFDTSGCTCGSGQGLCGGVCTDLNTTVNCGGCGVPCSTPHATATCATGTCHVQACNAGFVDCNSNPSDGCECVGTGCCGTGGTSCQTQHSNGLGQFFYDCVALGTHNQTQAMEACAAANGGSTSGCAQFSCGDGHVVCDNGGNSACNCWQYDGTSGGAGHVNTSCGCPSSPDQSWN